MINQEEKPPSRLTELGNRFIDYSDQQLDRVVIYICGNDRSMDKKEKVSPLLRFVIMAIVVCICGFLFALAVRRARTPKLPELFDWPVDNAYYLTVNGEETYRTVSLCREIMRTTASPCMHPASYDDTPRNILVTKTNVYPNPTHVKRLSPSVIVKYQSLNPEGGERVSRFSPIIELFYGNGQMALIDNNDVAFCIQSYGLRSVDY